MTTEQDAYIAEKLGWVCQTCKGKGVYEAPCFLTDDTDIRVCMNCPLYLKTPNGMMMILKGMRKQPEDQRSKFVAEVIFLSQTDAVVDISYGSGGYGPYLDGPMWLLFLTPSIVYQAALKAWGWEG